ncbi:MAG: ABC transporter ATP-binding protein [Thaumarchaeota archaeon]|nr:ABC transporter ATP-binding protein [Nitrososphaerota archaeon]
MASLLSVSRLSVAYQLTDLIAPALNDVSIEIPSPGYTLGLVGESGSGKTTLGVSLMNGVESPGRIISGKIEFEGNDILKFGDSELRRYRWGDVAMIYQSAMNSLNPIKKVSEHITEVIRKHGDASKSEAYKQAIQLLDEVNIKEDRANDYPHELSGGMRQRVVIALAMALSPKVLIADEPTSALDVVTQKQILGMIKKQVRDRGLAMLMITHDISILVGLVDNIAVLHRGEIVEIGSLEEVLESPLHPYSEVLVSSTLTMDANRDILQQFRGKRSKDSIMTTVGSHCKYASRCKYVFGRCQIESPVLREVKNGRWVACHKY